MSSNLQYPADTSFSPATALPNNSGNAPQVPAQVPQQVVIPMSGTNEARQEADVDITCPAVAGFTVGYFTWLFGAFLCCVGGDGRRTNNLRKGLLLGIIASSIPIGIIIAGYIILLTTYSYY